MMPKKIRVPKYCLHKRSGHARVKINGQEIFLGWYGTTESLRKYDRLIAELGTAPAVASPAAATQDAWQELTLVELMAAYLAHARSYYPSTSVEPDRIIEAIRVLRDLYGKTLAIDFSPKHLQAVRHAMIGQGIGRKLINGRANKIKRMFKWAAVECLLPPTVYDALKHVEGLRRGYTEAKESPPVLPVSEADIQATLPHLSPVVADIVRIQRLTGARPSEICTLTPGAVDRTGDIWGYHLAEHKTSWKGKDRTICIGPQAQAILLPYLLRADDAYCFSPIESEERRRAERHEQRRTPLSYGNRRGSNRKSKPRRTPGDHYTRDSYRKAIHRACDLADIPRWSPNRLRHSAATEIRQKYGLEAAQVALGHARADVTQIYAERDMVLAERVMRESG